MRKTPRVVAVIPARHDSKRLPGKPLAEIAGKPMIQWVYERTAEAETIDSVVVATDDDRIAQVVRDFGGRAVVTPTTIETGTDRIALVAEELESTEIVVNVQGDEPLLQPQMVDEAVRPMMTDPSIQVGTLVRKLDTLEELHNPSVVKVVMDASSHALYFSRSVVPFVRDDKGREALGHGTYFKHIGLYVFRREFLLKYPKLRRTPLEVAERLEQLRILEHGYRIHVAITQHDSVPVDTPEDLERVRQLLRR